MATRLEWSVNIPVCTCCIRFSCKVNDVQQRGVLTTMIINCNPVEVSAWRKRAGSTGVSWDEARDAVASVDATAERGESPAAGSMRLSPETTGGIRR